MHTEQLMQGKDLLPGDVIRTNVPYSERIGRIDSLQDHASFEGWRVARFYDKRVGMSIDPEGFFKVVRG